MHTPCQHGPCQTQTCQRRIGNRTIKRLPTCQPGDMCCSGHLAPILILLMSSPMFRCFRLPDAPSLVVLLRMPSLQFELCNLKASVHFEKELKVANRGNLVVRFQAPPAQRFRGTLSLSEFSSVISLCVSERKALANMRNYLPTLSGSTKCRWLE